MPVAEYEASVGARNQLFHESAEAVRLARDGVIPLDEDPADDLDTSTGSAPGNTPTTH